MPPAFFEERPKPASRKGSLPVCKDYRISHELVRDRVGAAEGSSLSDMMFTSGTTGKPKGCVHAQTDLFFAALASARPSHGGAAAKPARLGQLWLWAATSDFGASQPRRPGWKQATEAMRVPTTSGRAAGASCRIRR